MKVLEVDMPDPEPILVTLALSKPELAALVRFFSTVSLNEWRKRSEHYNADDVPMEFYDALRAYL